MARLQILELPTGPDDRRPPFVLVIDQYVAQRYIIGPDQPKPVDKFERIAKQIGARAVLVFPEIVEIPANGLPLTGSFELVGDESTRRDVERMDAITDALGIDRLRDWDQIVAAVRGATGGHRFGVPWYLDPQRCARCGLDRQAWMFGRDRRTCDEVQPKGVG